MSHDLSERFRDLAEQYSAVLEHWRSFSELVTLGSPDRYRKAIDAWEGVKQAFLTAANTLAELRRDVPPEVANLWIGPTERVFVGYGSLRVGAALDTQPEWFQKWMREVVGTRDVGWIWERGFYSDLERLQDAIEDLMTAVEVIQEWERKRQAKAIITRLENPSARPEETAQAVVSADAQFQPTQNDSADSRRRRGWWVKKAVELVSKYPELSDNQIAAMLGIHRSTLSKNDAFRKVAAEIRQQGNIRQGYRSGAQTDGIVAPVEEDA